MIFLHVLAQLTARVLIFAFLSVARAEKAMPVFLVFAGVAVGFSIYMHKQSGWVVSVLFAIPIWFLCWQSSTSRDIFGWRHGGKLVCFFRHHHTGYADVAQQHGCLAYCGHRLDCLTQLHDVCVQCCCVHCCSLLCTVLCSDSGLKTLSRAGFANNRLAPDDLVALP